MEGRIKIDSERCKGCGLCVDACPRKSIAISTRSNSIGCFPAETLEGGCNGCAMCAIVCPECAIQVQRRENIFEDKGRTTPAGCKAELFCRKK